MEERTLPRYPAGKRELIFGLLVLLFGTFTWNSILYGGFCLGFALGAVALTGCSFWYLLRCGFRPGKYEAALLILAAAIFAGFARSSDGNMKAGMLLMALFAVNLSFCRMAGQSRREPGGIASALDAPRALFTLGVGSMSAAVRGLNDARKNAGTAGKRSGAAILGVLIALPVAAVLIVLLMRADAAFEGLMDMLPDTDWSEPLLSLFFGVFAGWILYSRGVGLKYAEKNGKEAKSFHGFSAITVNILLGTVCLIYAVYLLSQLAYLGSGFAGILPDGYTLAEYARRGFFEMAWLSFINLGLMCLAMGLVEKKAGAPALTRGLCLFLGLAALFLIATASAKIAALHRRLRPDEKAGADGSFHALAGGHDDPRVRVAVQAPIPLHEGGGDLRADSGVRHLLGGRGHAGRPVQRPRLPVGAAGDHRHGAHEQPWGRRTALH